MDVDKLIAAWIDGYNEAAGHDSGDLPDRTLPSVRGEAGTVEGEAPVSEMSDDGDRMLRGAVGLDTWNDIPLYSGRRAIELCEQFLRDRECTVTNGKGSTPRPVDPEKFGTSFDEVFGTKPKHVCRNFVKMPDGQRRCYHCGDPEK